MGGQAGSRRGLLGAVLIPATALISAAGTFVVNDFMGSRAPRVQILGVTTVEAPAVAPDELELAYMEIPLVLETWPNDTESNFVSRTEAEVERLQAALSEASPTDANRDDLRTTFEKTERFLNLLRANIAGVNKDPKYLLHVRALVQNRGTEPIAVRNVGLFTLRSADADAGREFLRVVYDDDPTDNAPPDSGGLFTVEGRKPLHVHFVTERPLAKADADNVQSGLLAGQLALSTVLSGVLRGPGDVVVTSPSQGTGRNSADETEKKLRAKVKAPPAAPAEAKI